MNKQYNLITLSIVFLLAIISSISAVSVVNVISTPSEVAPGEIVDINMEIENIFEYDIYNLNIKLDLSSFDVPFAPFQSSSERFLDKLKDGDDERFSFKLIAIPSAGSGIYKLPIQITYEDNEGQLFSKSELISVTINAQPELKVSLELESTLIKGQENEFSIKIINSGLSDVKFLYLSVNDAPGINFLSEKEQYIGDVDSDDFDSVSFKAYISESSSNLITLPVTIKFRDSTNKEFILSKTVSLNIYSLESAQELGLAKKPNYTIYIVVVILVLWYFIRKYLKKRKRRKARRQGK